MKKVLFIICLIMFLTGCSAEYNVTINKATIKETLEISEDMISNWYSDVEPFGYNYSEVINDKLNEKTGIYIDEQLVDHEPDNPNYIFYNPKKIKTNEKLGIQYNYTFDKDNYDRAYFPNNCFEYIKVYENIGNLTISTSKGFNCMGDGIDLSNLTVNITTRYKVVDSNHDITEGNTYTWIINKSNYDNKNIYIKVNTNKLAENKETNNEKISVKLLLTFGLSLALLIIIVIIFLMNKKRRLGN